MSQDGDMKDPEPTFDTDGYPTADTLHTVAAWEYPFGPLMEYIRKAWRYADDGYWTQNGNTYRISTAGWSGNENLIAALQENRLLWLLCWQESRRGGHYTFEVK